MATDAEAGASGEASTRATDLVERIAGNIRDHLVGSAVHALADEMSRRAFDDTPGYADGALEALRREATRIADAANAEQREIDELFGNAVRARAEAARHRAYGTPLHAGVLPKASEWSPPSASQRGHVHPQWAVTPSAQDPLLAQAADALDDVLAGVRVWRPDHGASDPPSGELRAHPEAGRWAVAAIQAAADRCVPPLDDLYAAARSQIAGTGQLLEANNLWAAPREDPLTAWTETNLRAAPMRAAGQAHVSDAGELVEGWRERFVTEFAEAAPERLADSIRDAGLGVKLGTTKREAARIHGSIDAEAVRAYTERQSAHEGRPGREDAAHRAGEEPAAWTSTLPVGRPERPATRPRQSQGILGPAGAGFAGPPAGLKATVRRAARPARRSSAEAEERPAEVVAIEPATRAPDLVERMAQNARRQLVGLAMQHTAEVAMDMHFRRRFWYRKGALEGLQQRGREVAEAAAAELPELEARFGAHVHARAGTGRHPEGRSGAALPGLAPDWSKLFPARPIFDLVVAGSRLDDVLAGTRDWYPDYSGSNNGIGELREAPEAIAWLTEAIERAAPVPDLAALRRAEDAQVTATGALLRGYDLLKVDELTPSQARLLAAPELEAGADLLAKVDGLVEGCRAQYVDAFVDAAPKRLREVVEVAGHGHKLEVSQHQAHLVRDRAGAERNRRLLAGMVPRQDREVPVAVADGGAARPAASEKPALPGAEVVERNAVDGPRTPTPREVARLHPWVAAGEHHGQNTPPRLPAAVGAGFSEVRDKFPKSAAPTPALPCDQADTPARTAAATETTVNTGPGKTPTHGEACQLTVERSL